MLATFFVKNDSTPPMTQFSNEPFDFWLPEGAIVEGSAALAPGGMPVQAAPVPLTEKNHYTFLFPIRPGETRFQVTYHILSHQLKERVRLHAMVASIDPSIDSITPVWPSANFYEREVWDLFGVRFHGHPGLRRIMLPEDVASEADEASAD